MASSSVNRVEGSTNMVMNTLILMAPEGLSPLELRNQTSEAIRCKRTLAAQFDFIRQVLSISTNLAERDSFFVLSFQLQQVKKCASDFLSSSFDLELRRTEICTTDFSIQICETCCYECQVSTRRNGALEATLERLVSITRFSAQLQAHDVSTPISNRYRSSNVEQHFLKMDVVDDLIGDEELEEVEEVGEEIVDEDTNMDTSETE